MTELRIIGDQIYYDGELVALIADGITPTLEADFRDAVASGLIDGDAPDVHPFDTLLTACKTLAKGGLIRYADLLRVSNELREQR